VNAAAAVAFRGGLTGADNTAINDAGTDPSNLPSVLPSIGDPIR